MVIKTGDVVQVKACAPPKDMPGWECYCIFCACDSTRIGVIVGTDVVSGVDRMQAVFDFGDWPMHVEDFDPALNHMGGGAKVISTS